MREAVQHPALATARAVRPSIGLGGQRRGAGIGKRTPAGVFARLREVLRFHELVKCSAGSRGGGGISYLLANRLLLGERLRE